jgi:hypothetical protein
VTSAEQTWELATNLVEGMKSTGIDTDALSTVASLAGTIVSAAFPALLEIGKPFLSLVLLLPSACSSIKLESDILNRAKMLR